ncbi:OmpA family protein [Vibrio olivae]|uniref:OmpA family protein n=1 Tax=Vibrio olivae TaxID=1243002 RepID=A0ABV5HLB9_9VIBR
MNKLTTLLGGFGLFILSAQTYADAYIGAKIGKSWLDDACVVGEACDDEDMGGGIFAGYNLNPYIGIELGYDYLGEFTTGVSGDGLSDESISAFSLTPKLSYPVLEQLAIYGRAGGAYVDFDGDNHWSFTGAVGFEFKVMTKGALRLEYQTITDVNDQSYRTQGNLISIGFIYDFGGKPTPVPVMMEKESKEITTTIIEKPPQPVIKTFEAQRLDSGLFALNSANLKPESHARLDSLVSFLRTYPQASVNIIGYTDSSGSAEYNLQLSERRAQSVAKVLQERGIAASRIRAEGRGESEPIADNSTPEGRERNRRVEIFVPPFEYTVAQ